MCQASALPPAAAEARRSALGVPRLGARLSAPQTGRETGPFGAIDAFYLK